MFQLSVELYDVKHERVIWSDRWQENWEELSKIKRSAAFAKQIGLEAHAGHGLNYKTAYKISKIKYISELNIGHFIISESIFIGLKKTIKRFRSIINN